MLGAPYGERSTSDNNIVEGGIWPPKWLDTPQNMKMYVVESCESGLII